MEAAEKTLTYRDDMGLHKKLLLLDKDPDKTTESKSDESNYVDLDMRPDGLKTVCGLQVSVVQSEGVNNQTVPVEIVSKPPGCDQDAGVDAEPDPSDYESDDLQYTDMCLSSRTESDDSASAVLSEPSLDALEDESHYITTHEIQLTELDHDVDYDLGQGTCWDFEDNNFVYSFVDYASFESDDTREVSVSVSGRNQNQNQNQNQARSEQEESDLCASSDESLCKHPDGDPGAGQIHLKIQTSAAVDEPVSDHHADSGARTGALYDRAPYFIPAPGRQHLASKLRRKDINEYSSGASSSVSELDDADKEVRNLTAKSFRSLACPYFDAIKLSASSESSMSEPGLNKWSAYVDWGFRNISQEKRDRGVFTHKSLGVKSQNNGASSDKTAQTTNRSRDPALRSHQQHGEVTLNLRCKVEAGEKARSKDVIMEGTHKRAVFASSLLKNVISKKMQFEQDRKQERYCRESNGRKFWRRQSSDSGSGFNSGDDQQVEGDLSQRAGELNNSKDGSDPRNKELPEPPKTHLSHSQTSAFDSVRPEPLTSVSDSQETNRMTKVLFVQQPSEEFPTTPVTRAQTGPQAYNRPRGSHEAMKNPGIKIHLRGVKESKGCTLNIANLLTPKFSNNTINTFKAATNAKCHSFSASSEKTPSFTVRDIRDTKCKFTAPIYHVRDVRKLVKSSYRFVSLDNSASKCIMLDRHEEKPQSEPAKHRLPSPIVIKCQSVKTNKSNEEDADPPETPQQNSNEDKAVESVMRKFEPKIPKQAALEKLKAAVKTMEQLYVYDRNEWKRRAQTPRPASDMEPNVTAGDKKALNIICVPYHDSDKRLHQNGHSGSKPESSVATTKRSESPGGPLRVKIGPQTVPPPSVPAVALDSENYLTIPGLTHQAAPPSPEPVSKATNRSQHRTGDSKTSERRLMTPSPGAVIHHQPPAAPQTHQVLCFSPSVNTVSPAPSPGETVPRTQRKMLLDPTTGDYYLVDTPVRPATKRLFDPETGRFVDVPMSGSPPITPVTAVTPVPLSLSPLSLGPGAYMICPGLIPSPTLGAQVLSPHSHGHLVNGGGGKVNHTKTSKQDLNAGGAESAYYSATGETLKGSLQLPVSVGNRREAAGGSERKPVVSVTSQQGPRIIAPPSFDGTTMSFVVEHR